MLNPCSTLMPIRPWFVCWLCALSLLIQTAAFSAPKPILLEGVAVKLLPCDPFPFVEPKAKGKVFFGNCLPSPFSPARTFARHGHMENAAAGQGEKRVPIEVVEHPDGLLYVRDGNATVQVLMMAQWIEVPVIIVVEPRG